MSLTFRPIWFDSLGAKSSCTLVKTPDISVLIDPGIAVMQPSFPASWTKKLYWEELGIRAIKKASEKANVIVISHYHYDHFFPHDLSIYKNKILFTKNPNEYINDSQRTRAENFFNNICKCFGKIKLEEILRERKNKKYPDPMINLPLAKHKDFGDYDQRRRQLLNLGKKWFYKRVSNWNKNLEIPEVKFDHIEVRYPEGKVFEFGKTKLSFTKPLFHGIEYSRVGWIFSTVIEHKKEKLIHSSDLSGIYIEDYVEWLIQENPQVLILDGPPTYMGFMLIKTNLKRCVENTCKIIKESKNLELIIYDHHLLREKGYKEKTQNVWKVGKEMKVKIMTAAEYLGMEPKVLEAKN